jgi:hypothetical protein
MGIFFTWAALPKKLTKLNRSEFGLNFGFEIVTDRRLRRGVLGLGAGQLWQ